MKKARKERVCTAKERISRMPPCAAGKRSSIYRGVTRISCSFSSQLGFEECGHIPANQIIIYNAIWGAYDDEEAAARAYDLAALKYWGAGTLINFPVRYINLHFWSLIVEKAVLSQEGFLNIVDFPGTSREVATDGKYAGGFGMERKVDLTSYIRWWAPKKTRQSESTSNAEGVARELRTLECSVQPTEPYQLPSLGLPHKGKPHARGVSACSILSKSEPFKNFLEKSSKTSETKDDTSYRDMEHGRAAPVIFSGGGLDRSGVTLGLSELAVQRTPYSFAPLVSAPLRTTWNSVDPVPDPVFWTSLVPPSGQSLTTMVQTLPATSYPSNT
ncbi:AP2-like ethylene-responsive transcription factor [Cocos nucifera]|uniref:AP2-like ethylene-responsive transcription factor n=1 Tax=Cocos nucifera TaxID=13894 RepID=A0A8K0MXS5_COCNU|nr:AP2-like ethylene-responsive transcription factor [Cocos nucifera]